MNTGTNWLNPADAAKVEAMGLKDHVLSDIHDGAGQLSTCVYLDSVDPDSINHDVVDVRFHS